MTKIEVAIDIPAPSAIVWEEISDIGSHVNWMADAEEIDFVGSQTAGVGTVFRCRTKVGPFRTTDEMAVREWNPLVSMSVDHVGLFTGSGRFRISELPADLGTRFEWTEELTFPWYFGGPVGALLAKPMLMAIWRGNLSRLRAAVLSRGTADK